MRRWFPALALLALALWGATLVALVAGRSSRVAADQAQRAVWATLVAHASVIVWFRATRPRPTVPTPPPWWWVQVAKHQRQGIYLAGWGIVVLGLGWGLVRGEEVAGGWPEPAVWFGTTFSLGFQPGIFLAEWLVITAQTRLQRLESGLVGDEAVAGPALGAID